MKGKLRLVEAEGVADWEFFGREVEGGLVDEGLKIGWCEPSTNQVGRKFRYVPHQLTTLGLRCPGQTSALLCAKGQVGGLMNITTKNFLVPPHSTSTTSHTSRHHGALSHIDLKPMGDFFYSASVTSEMLTVEM